MIGAIEVDDPVTRVDAAIAPARWRVVILDRDGDVFDGVHRRGTADGQQVYASVIAPQSVAIPVGMLYGTVDYIRRM